MEPIRLHFAYTPLDRQRAYRLYKRRSGRNLRDKIYAGICIVIGVADFSLNFYPTLV